MKNILKYNKIILVIYMVVAISFGAFFNCYIIAASNIMNISGPASIEEGKTITFNITFANNVDNIWLSDGDIIKKGFSVTVKVNKISDRNYTVIISNISNVGTGKYIVINSGVGYIEGKPTDSVTSNMFEITAKQVAEENNGNNTENNTGNNNGNTTSTPDVNNTPVEKPDTGNGENVQEPSTDNNTNNNTNNNTDNNVNNNTSNNTSNDINNNVNNAPVVDNSNTNQPATNNTINNTQNNETVETKIEKIKREIPNTGKLI